MQRESKGKPTPTRQGHNTLDSGSVDLEMGRGRRFGQTVPNTKVTGRITELMETESSLISMVIFTRETGSTIRPTARDNTSM